MTPATQVAAASGASKETAIEIVSSREASP